MIGRFYESFGRKKDETQELPKEVIDILNEMLPDNFVYELDGEGHYRAVPRPEKIGEGIKLITQFGFDEKKDAEIISKLKRISRDKWEEYFYRTQMKVPIKKARVGDENKQIPVEELARDPLEDEKTSFADGFIQAYPFPEPIRMTFESPEGDVAQIGIQQQKYDSLVEIKYGNIDFPALKMDLYRFSPLVEEWDEESHTTKDNPAVVTYSVTPSNASSVKEALTALRIFRGLFNGTTKINGHIISPEGGKGKFDPKIVEDALSFWETAQKVEEKLNVHFDPKAECLEKDIRFFAELQNCLLDGKAIVWRHPFDRFNIAGFHSGGEKIPFGDAVGKDSIRYEFMEGPISATLLGAEFELYSRTIMKDFIITNVEWDNDEKGRAEVYISDVPNKQWTLTRLYMTEADMRDYIKKPDEQK